MYKLIQGVLLGVAIGILIAPDKGSETIKRLLNRANDIKDDTEDYLTDAADTVKTKAKDIAGTVKSKAADIASNLTSKVAGSKNDVENS